MMDYEKMDYEKMYKAMLTQARDYHERCQTEEAKRELEAIFPELRESEDERVINAIIGILKNSNAIDINVSHEKMFAWLEKQKESLHIPETCKENAEYFTSQCGDNRFELIDKAKRDIVAKTNIESSPDEMKVLDSFLFRAWQMGWLGKYDVIVPEQKPVEKQDYSGLNDLERAILRGFLCAGVENVHVTIIKETAQECLAQMKPADDNPLDDSRFTEGFDAGRTVQKIFDEPKPAEWSEEDEMYLSQAIETLEHENYSILADKLKSLRPSWKPSEDEERLINTSISFLKDFADKGYENAVECIDWLKSKLNGNSGK